LWRDDSYPERVTSPGALHELLRNLPVLQAHADPFETDTAPSDPAELFVSWLLAAVEARVAEPHTMTISTADEHGRPDARVLILRDLDADGWWFASATGSAKVRQLEANPLAALTFYWQELGQQVRVRGPVVRAGEARTAADFNRRSTAAQAVTLTQQQSQPAGSRAEIANAIAAKRAELDGGAEPTASAWTLRAVAAESVEFWQADSERQHARLAYTRTATGEWNRQLLWP
jgi:pyridoxamine 5'-phosphate oxidase